MRALTDSERRAAAVLLPMVNSATDPVERYKAIVAVSTTAGSFIVPSHWKGKFCSFMAIGANVWIQGSVGAAVAVDATKASTADGEVDQTDVGKKIPLGEERHYQLPECRDATDLYINFDADASGTLEICLAST